MLFALAAISVGFLGSFHCIGMCGPIALALPFGSEAYSKRLLRTVLYNSGRIVTYTLFGLLFGLIGEGFFIGGYQRALSLSIGSLLLLSVIFPQGIPLISRTSGGLFNLFVRLKNNLSKLFLKSGYRSTFLIGLLNGLLPCGLVYIAVAGAVSSGHWLSGAAFMFFFGLGTLPFMILLPLFGNLISVSFRNNLRRMVPAFVSCMAILLILRGLNLGIPYLSPRITSNGDACHTGALKAGVPDGVPCPDQNVQSRSSHP